MELPDILNLLERPISKYTELDDHFEMYLAAFIQGIKGINNKDPEDIQWILNKSEHILSFNWYCALFNLDPIIIRNVILNRSGYAGLVVTIRNTDENHQSINGDSGIHT